MWDQSLRQHTFWYPSFCNPDRVLSNAAMALQLWVYGKYFFSTASFHGLSASYPKQRQDTPSRRFYIPQYPTFSTAFQASSDTVMMDKSGGRLRHFWEPKRPRSMRLSFTLTGTPIALATKSTYNRAPCIQGRIMKQTHHTAGLHNRADLLNRIQSSRRRFAVDNSHEFRFEAVKLGLYYGNIRSYFVILKFHYIYNSTWPSQRL